MSDNTKKRRIMTSAIDDMTVTEVRKHLSDIRSKWKNRSRDYPFYITDTLQNGLTVGDFALKFLQGHHRKRNNKVKMMKTSPEDQDAHSELSQHAQSLSTRTNKVLKTSGKVHTRAS
jgi:hypothetical protein